MKIIKPNQSIFYLNCDDFRSKLNETIPLKNSITERTIRENVYKILNITLKLKKFSKLIFKKCKSNYNCCQTDKSSSVKINEEDQKLNSFLDIKSIIIDFSLVQFVDESGVKCLNEILKEYEKENVKILLTNINGNFKLLSNSHLICKIVY